MGSTVPVEITVLEDEVGAVRRCDIGSVVCPVLESEVLEGEVVSPGAGEAQPHEPAGRLDLRVVAGGIAGGVQVEVMV